MKNSSIDLPLVSDNPSSVRLNDDDKKAVAVAKKIILARFKLPRGFRLNTSNILRITLHEFVDNEQAKNKA